MTPRCAAGRLGYSTGMVTRTGCLAVLFLVSSCSGGSAAGPDASGADAARVDGGVTGSADASRKDVKPGGGPDAKVAADGSQGGHDDATGPVVDSGSPVRDGGHDAGSAVPPSAAAALAQKLRGGSPHFLMGMGNDLASDHNMDGAYTLGATLDLHYVYLSGLEGQGGWPDWNAGGTFVDIMTSYADMHGVTPMFTLYSMAAQGQNNMAALTNDAFMTPYWAGAKLLFQRLGVYGKASIVHIEPDFWAFAQQASPTAKAAVHVTTLVPECAAVTDDMIGLAGCFRILARKYAPEAAIGFHVSVWAGDVPTTIAFFQAIGAGDADFLVTDVIDRDAGCYEAHTDPNCQRGGTTGWYLDETNQTSPNFHENFAWVKQMTDAIKLPMLWWQVPFGAPSMTPGGSAGMYRDNHVDYFFKHVDELAAAGGVGVAFGTGAGNQTYITSDGNEFENAVKAYFAAPYALH